MINRKILLAAMFFVALTLGGLSVAQMNRANSVTITIPTGNHIINVDQTNACVDVESQIGNVGDTMTWQINTSATGVVTDFHVIFLRESPFTSGRRYFDKSSNFSSAAVLKAPTNHQAQAAYEYVISADGGQPCDPHVIVIGGKHGKQ